MKLFYPLKEYDDLPLWEVKTLGTCKVEGEIIICNTRKNADHLALTKIYGTIIFSDHIKNFETKLSKLSLNKFYKESFSLRVPQKRSLEKKYASLIWNCLKKPKVNLTNPKTQFFIFFGKKTYLIKGKKLNQKFEKRRNTLLPAPHPSSTHPKISRAMINLIDSKIVLDPFCGSGGILIESALMNKKTTGYDIDPIMLKRAKKNLSSLELKATLKLKDSTKEKNIPYIVTDLPYGKNTKTTVGLYEEFFKDLKFKKAVVGIPDEIKLNLKKKPTKEFIIPLNRHLKKKIMLF